MRNRRPSSFRSIFGLLLLTAACSDQAPEPDPIRIGVILAQTGAASFLGEPEAAVLRALMESRNDSGFVLDIRDSGGDAARAQLLFDAFAADSSVIGVIGPSTSGESIALGASADARKLVLMSLAAAKRIVFDDAGATRPYVFKFAQNDDLAAARLAAVMRANGQTSVAMLYSDDAFGTGGAEAFRAVAADNPMIQITTDASYAAQLQSADAVAAQIGANVPAVIIWGTTPGPALIVKALRQRGYNGRIYLSHGNATGAFLQDAGAAAEGAYVVGSRLLISPDRLVNGNPVDEVIRSYLTLWARISTGTPSTFGGHARDALEAIVAVSDVNLRSMGPTARRLALRDRLEALRGFNGVTGVFSFSATDHAGLPATAFELYHIESGRFVLAPIVL
jgi:branched-chain amino acid transport system substrate-binding protein